MCVCVSVGWTEAIPCQHDLLHLSLFHSFSLPPPHFHVYRLGLMVCILTILVWKPADSPALWAWQGCRFIREWGSYSLHQFSWNKFAIFLFGFLAVRQTHSHSDSAGVIPGHNTAALTEWNGLPSLRTLKMCRWGVNISENLGQQQHVLLFSRYIQFLQ